MRPARPRTPGLGSGGVPPAAARPAAPAATARAYAPQLTGGNAWKRQPPRAPRATQPRPLHRSPSTAWDRGGYSAARRKPRRDPNRPGGPAVSVARRIPGVGHAPDDTSRPGHAPLAADRKEISVNDSHPGAAEAGLPGAPL